MNPTAATAVAYPAVPARAFTEALEQMDRTVFAIGPNDWCNPTPCAAWNVTDLLGHVVVELSWMAPLLAGRSVAQIRGRLAGDLLGDDPIGAWERASAHADRAVRAADAAQLVDTSRGAIAAGEYVTEVFADILVHTWDLARALGTGDRLPSELVQQCAAWFAGVEEVWRSAAIIDARPPIAADHDGQTQLLAAFGRRADWRPRRSEAPR